MQDLPDVIPSWARHATSVDGTRKGIRREVDFAAGSSKVTIAGVDSATGDKVTVTIDVSESSFTTAILKTLIDAEGDLIIGTADNAVDRLAVGSANRVLGVSAGRPSWQAQTYIDHGSVTGLADDDHTQYTRKDTLTAKGSVYVASAASTPAAQAAGSDYFVPQWLASATNGLQAGPTTQTWTPTLAQGASSNISKTVTRANYWRVGPLVFLDLRLDATAAGTAGSTITATLPVTAAASAVFGGSGAYLDTAVNVYEGVCYLPSTTTVSLVATHLTTFSLEGIGNRPNIAVASGDVFFATCWYLAA